MIKFLARFIKHCIIFLALELPMQLIGMILLAIALPFCKSPQLPYILRWFDLADFYVGRDPVTYLTQIVPKGWKERWYWIAWRNPCNYFAYKYLGIPANTVLTLNERSPSDPASYDLVGDATGKTGGLAYSEYKAGSRTYYEYYYVLPYTIFGARKCFRFRMGWKIGGEPTGEPIQQVFVISPIRDYRGN